MRPGCQRATDRDRAFPVPEDEQLARIRTPGTQVIAWKGPRRRSLPKILVDADGCPVKEEVYRVAGRYGLEVAVVANSRIHAPSSERIRMVVVDGRFDAADDWIVE